MRLHPKKCTFEVEVGKFLSYMVSHKGIKVNPEKIRAILKMSFPRLVKNIQRLASRMALLNRFISRSIDKCFIFKLLRNSTRFV